VQRLESRVLLGRDVHGRRDLLARQGRVTLRDHMHMVNGCGTLLERLGSKRDGEALESRGDRGAGAGL
jgi:hypothetical protein